MTVLTDKELQLAVEVGRAEKILDALDLTMDLLELAAGTRTIEREILARCDMQLKRANDQLALCTTLLREPLRGANHPHAGIWKRWERCERRFREAIEADVQLQVRELCTGGINPAAFQLVRQRLGFDLANSQVYVERLMAE